jgi:uncharacterized OB-fold protein
MRETWVLGVAGAVALVLTREVARDAPYPYVLVELDGGGRVSGSMPGIRSDSDLAVGDRVRFVPDSPPGVSIARVSPQNEE